MSRDVKVKNRRILNMKEVDNTEKYIGKAIPKADSIKRRYVRNTELEQVWWNQMSNSQKKKVVTYARDVLVLPKTAVEDTAQWLVDKIKTADLFNLINYMRHAGYGKLEKYPYLMKLIGYKPVVILRSKEVKAGDVISMDKEGSMYNCIVDSVIGDTVTVLTIKDSYVDSNEESPEVRKFNQKNSK